MNTEELRKIYDDLLKDYTSAYAEVAAARQAMADAKIKRIRVKQEATTLEAEIDIGLRNMYALKKPTETAIANEIRLHPASKNQAEVTIIAEAEYLNADVNLYRAEVKVKLLDIIKETLMMTSAMQRTEATITSNLSE